MPVSVENAAEQILESFRVGSSLPRPAYTSAELFAVELDRVVLANWLFVAPSSAIGTGAHLTWSVAGESVVLARTADGVLHAHHNVCRHRGSRLLPDGAGRGRTLVCGYHAWTYGLDGALRAAGGMAEDFTANCAGEFGLRPVPVREVNGLVFVCFAEAPPSFEGAAAAMSEHLAPYQAERTKVAARYQYSIPANWKILVENNRECYHCRPNHPEFCLSNFDLGMNGDRRTNPDYERELARHQALWRGHGLSARTYDFPDGEPYRVARLPLRDGFRTESMSGQQVAPLLGTLTAAEAGSVRVITLPNSWSHVNADYLVTTRLTPVAVDRTDVELTFLVHADAQEGTDYTAADVAQVWRETSEQDWELCERNYAGVRSRAYRPGPLSPVTEQSLMEFHRWWLTQLEAS